MITSKDVINWTGCKTYRSIKRNIDHACDARYVTDQKMRSIPSVQKQEGLRDQMDLFCREWSAYLERYALFARDKHRVGRGSYGDTVYKVPKELPTFWDDPTRKEEVAKFLAEVPYV